MNAYRFVILSFLVINIGCSSGFKDTSTNDEWVSLLDKNLSQWDTYIGVPHHTVKNLEGVPKGDGMKGTALGLNNDPLKVFSTIEADGEVNLKVGGEIYGGLTSKKEYENYHLKLEFRWGEKKWKPRLNKLRDNGILYHCIGEHGAFWNVWMQSQEFQIQEGDMGDYYGLAGSVNNIHAIMQEDSFYVYNASAEVIKLGSGQGNKMYRCVREKNFEKRHGEWNTLELVCLNGKSYHIVNGELVMILDKAESKTENGFSPVTRGKIQLQSEGAEAYYRRVKIKELQELPDFLK
jgi:hypothetical protein